MNIPVFLRVCQNTLPRIHRFPEPHLIRRNDSIGIGERMLLACIRRRLAAGFVSGHAPGSMEVCWCPRRDAAAGTPEACATLKHFPQFKERRGFRLPFFRTFPGFKHRFSQQPFFNFFRMSVGERLVSVRGLRTKTGECRTVLALRLLRTWARIPLE